MTVQLYEIAGSKLSLNFHSGQLKAWDSNARIIAVTAGSQGGKTSFGPWWLWRETVQRGSGDYIAATSSYDLFKLKMLPEIRNVFEHILKIGRYWSGDKVIEIADPKTGKFMANRADDPMWARIILRSAEAKGGLESTTAKAAWLDEAGQDAFTIDAYEAVRRRLTLHRGRILITTTPYNLGWLKTQVVDRNGHDGIEVIQFESIQNPNFSREEFDELRATMPTWKFNMFMRGLYTRPPGMIYSDFVDEYRERGGHKVKPFHVPIEWPRICGVDPGIINTSKVWLAHDESADTYYLYRESLGERKSAKEHAREALELARANNERVIKWAVGSKSEVYHREDWIAAGAGAKGVVEPTFSDVEAGIDRLIALLRQNKLYIFDSCVGTLGQFTTYSREVDAMGQPTESIKDKAKFHYLDALRYAALAIPTRSTIIATVRRYA